MTFRVFYLIPHANITGGNKVVFEQADRLGSRGYQVYILTDEGETSKWIDTKAEVVRKDLWEGKFRQEDALIFTWDYDVDYVLRQECRRFYLIQHFIHPLEQIFCLPLDGFLSVSKWIQEDTLREYGVNSFLVPNGVDHEVFYPRLSVEREQAYVLAIDWRNGPKWKGFVDVEESIKLVKKTLPNVHFEAVGGQTPHEMAEHYSRATVYVSGSWYEGFGLPLLEAMACGCAVVTTGNRGSDEFAAHEETCLKVPAKKPKQAAEAILRILREESLRQRLVKNGIGIAQHYIWNPSIDILEYGLGLRDQLPDNHLAHLQPPRAFLPQQRWDERKVREVISFLIEVCRTHRKGHSIRSGSWLGRIGALKRRLSCRGGE